MRNNIKNLHQCPLCPHFALKRAGELIFASFSKFICTARNNLRIYKQSAKHLYQQKDGASCAVNANWTYVRAEIVDDNGYQAWTNPIYLAELL